MGEITGFPHQYGEDIPFNPEFLPNIFFMDKSGNVVKAEYQPERLNPETSSPYGVNRLLLETPMSEEMAKSFGRCDSLNSVVTQREEPEEDLPPGDRS